MKQTTTVVLAIAVVLVAFFVYQRITSIETYVMPDVSDQGICPDGYVLMCVSVDLVGIDDVLPFPANLPKPCTDPDFPSKPICTPHPSRLRPPSKKV
jgi:hypothetical protein